MTGKDLKNSILQLAIQGKLVEQIEKEGSAKELLKKIEVEKKQLIEEGRMKKQKKLPEISEEEIPFDIPESWEWVRLSDVCILTDGVKVNEVSLPYLEARYLRGKIDPKIKKSGRFINKGEYVILVDGENSGEVFITEEEGILGSTFKVLTINSSIYDKYILNLLRFYQRLFRDRKRGAAIPHLDKNLFKSLVIAIPPVEEQKRIVAKIEELVPLVEKYEQVHSDVEELNKNFPEDMQKSILQYAIQGKLVDQRGEEGTAEELFKQIQEEKKKLTKEGKIKKQKKLPEIKKDEMPFDIPESWKWVRLLEVIDVRDGTHGTPDYVLSGYPLITGKDFYNGYFELSKTKYISVDDYSEISRRSKVEIGDILFSMIGGNIGSMVLINHMNYFDMAIKNVALFKQYSPNMIMSNYLLYYLQSQVPKMKASASGGAQAFVSLTFLRNYLIPLPPLEEQKRIVTKIEELLPYCQQLVK